MDNQRISDSEKLETLERIDGKYIWAEISSVLNFDKGIFYTINELLLRPGATVREFILYDRKRLVKPIVFVIFSSLVFLVAQQLLGFKTGTTPKNLENPSVILAFEWVNENFGIVNIILGFFIGFWIRVLFFKAKFNIYEIFILVFFVIGIGNLIFTFFGVVEITIGFESNEVTSFIALIYTTWAIGNFFDKKKISSYFKAMLAYIFGTSTGSLIIFIIGFLIDILNKAS